MSLYVSFLNIALQNLLAKFNISVLSANMYIDTTSVTNISNSVVARPNTPFIYCPKFSRLKY